MQLNQVLRMMSRILVQARLILMSWWTFAFSTIWRVIAALRHNAPSKTADVLFTQKSGRSEQTGLSTRLDLDELSLRPNMADYFNHYSRRWSRWKSDDPGLRNRYCRTVISLSIALRQLWWSLRAMYQLPGLQHSDCTWGNQSWMPWQRKNYIHEVAMFTEYNWHLCPFTISHLSLCLHFH